MPSSRLFTVRGRVQGVFFRDTTRRVAESLGLTGYAVNLTGGDVEVLACGDREAIGKLAVWLQDGPRMAVVDEVLARDIEIQAPAVFSTG